MQLDSRVLPTGRELSNRCSMLWMELVDELFQEYNNAIAKYSLNVEFLLDGAGTPGGNRTCLNQRWRPWNATYIISRYQQSMLA